MRNIVLVDGNPLMWRAVHSKGEINTAEFILKYFFHIAEKFRDYEILVLWDEGKSRWRSSFYTEYKTNRAAAKAKIDLWGDEKQKDSAIRYLEYFGVRSVTVPGIEADDIISVLSEYFSKVLMFDQVVIASRDRDLWQLVTDKVVVYDTFTNELIRETDVIEKFSVGPEGIASIKALAGDSSDNIMGISGIGDIRACKFLSEFGGIAGVMSVDNSKEIKKKKTSEKIVHDSEDMELSYQLVSLPKLYNLSYYLSSAEIEVLKEACTRPLQKEMMLARVEADLIGLQTYSRPDGFYGLENELLQFTNDWLNPCRISSDISARELDQSIYSCTRCSKHIECSSRDLPDGRISADFMVVTRSKSSDRTMLTRVLEGLELAPERIWWTQVSKCASSTPLTYGQMQSCSDFLMAEINLVKPKMIFALGLEAMEVLTPLRGKPSDHCGSILCKPDGFSGVVDSYVSVLIDPDLVLRSEKRKVDWMFGCQKVMEFFRKKRENK